MVMPTPKGPIPMPVFSMEGTNRSDRGAISGAPYPIHAYFDPYTQNFGIPLDVFRQLPPFPGPVDPFGWLRSAPPTGPSLPPPPAQTPMPWPAPPPAGQPAPPPAGQSAPPPAGQPAPPPAGQPAPPPAGQSAPSTPRTYGVQDLYIFGRDYQYKQGDLARAMREHGFGLGDKLTLEQWKTIFSNPFPKTKNPTGTTKAYFAALASGLGQWDALQEQAAQSGYNRPVLPSWSGGLPGSPVPAQPAGPGQGMLLDAMQQTLNPSPFQMPTNVPFMGKSPLPAFNPTQFIRDTTITPAPLAPPPVIAPVKIDTDINPLLRDQLAGKYAAKPMMETTEAYNKAVERMKSELAEAGLSESGATIAAVAENLTMPYLRQVQALWSESAGRAVDQLLGINTRNAELEFNRRAANAGFSSEHAKLAMETLNKVALAQADINSRQGVALGQLALGARAQDIGYISTAEQKNLDAYLQLLGVSFQDAMDIRNRVENATRYLLQDSQFHTAFGPQWYGMVQNAANSIMEALLRQQGFVTSAFNAYQSEYSKSKSGGGFSIGLV